MKRCNKCGILKPDISYTKHPKTKDRLQPTCRECLKLLRRKKIREYDRKINKLRYAMYDDDYLDNAVNHMADKLALEILGKDNAL